MTISYNGTFVQVLFLWKGSLWKSIWKGLLGYLVCFYIINMVYRFALNPQQKDDFKAVAEYFNNATIFIPLTFLLGFYVSLVVSRWWDQFNYISWPDRLMVYVAAYIRGTDDTTRLLRRTVARYFNLACALSWRSVSEPVFRRFPTTDHLVQAGLLTDKEYEVFKATPQANGNYFIPIMWIVNIFSKCRQQGLIDTIQYNKLMEELQLVRGSFGMIICYDWVSLPLVYTHVVTIATYGYFLFCLIGRQHESFIYRTDTNGHKELIGDLYIPLFTILQYLFYMGWLMVGQDLMNPFGTDDEDFEMNYIMNRNIQVAYQLGDDLSDQLPQMVHDAFWNIQSPILPHTKASLNLKEYVYPGAFAHYKMKEDKMKLLEEGSQPGTPTNELEPPLKRIQDQMRKISKPKLRQHHNNNRNGAESRPLSEPIPEQEMIIIDTDNENEQK